VASIGPGVEWQTGLAVVVFAVLAAGAARLGRLPTGWASVRAIARAVLQLVVVALVIGLVFDQVWGGVAFALVMLTVATVTSAARSGVRPALVWVAAAIVSGAAPVLAVVFGTGSTPVSAPSVIAICGIVIGGSMTACSLTLRRAFAALREQRGQVEAALALGFPRRQALQLVVEPDRPEALVPVLDQTRTVGLVTLPGAFVGVLLGGGSAGEAAAAQIIVLAGLIAAETITVVVAANLVAAGRILPEDVAGSLPSQ